ncbi:hypothetical protein CXB51_021378 [Gossypium anomalum]|uniref:Uncharacterized protein n=1 Tax=Gossypium anomalum TaxID=47600 RepID=A0A8J5YGW3_9ROSI|nr:hypothetical protein CXB51_021378 [Gossypium anomalum]
MPIKKDPSIPPPMISKIGPYTVFVTPPSTPSPTEPPVFHSPKKAAPPSPSHSPSAPPPVQPPPQQFDKSFLTSQSLSDGSFLGFFKNAAFKLQNAHSSLDDHLARWFGLNQSKYQWALDDYYESKGLEKEGVKVKEISSKIQSYIVGFAVSAELALSKDGCCLWSKDVRVQKGNFV